MGKLHELGTTGVLLAVWLGCAVSAHAACSGPPAMTAQLRAHPTTDNAVLLGSWFAGHQQFDCAIAVFRAALKGDPNSAQLHYLTGLALMETKHSADALVEVQRSAELEPDVLKPHIILASLYDEAGRHLDAEEQWKRALAIDPKSETALEGLSADFVGRKAYVEAAELLRGAPRTEKLTIRLSQALGLLNDLDDAAEVLTEAIEEHPESYPLADAMTVVLVKQRKYREAIKLLQTAVAAHPDNQDAQVELFRLLVLTNHIDLARPMGPKLLAARPKDPEVLYLNGVLQRSVGDYQGAKRLLEEAVAIEPDFFNSRYNLGMVLVFLHEWQEAKDQLEKAIALGALQAEAHFELAKALRGLGETERASAEMKLYQEMKKGEEAELEAAESVGLGDEALEGGKVKEAIAHYREATGGQPANADYHYKLALAMLRDGDEPGARKELEQTVQLDPKLPRAQNSLGFILSRSGDAEGAAQHFRMAVEAAPGWTEAWINLAAELAVGAHFAEARQAVTRALELDPSNAQAKELSDQLAKDPAAQQEHP